MKLARPYRMAPLAIATALAAELTPRRPPTPGVDADRGGRRSRRPGFLNLRLARRRARGDRRRRSCADPAAWGRRRGRDAARSVNVEFVSANPTGPLHVGNARGAFVGDLLCRVLEAGGQRVTREYYFNDSGGQIGNLGRVGRRAPPRRAGARGRLPGRLRGRPRGGAARRRLGGGDRRRRRHATAIVGRWAAGRVREGIEAQPRPRSASTSTSGRARRGSTTRAGSSGRSSGCASAATSTSRTARSGSARPPSATTRTGSSIRSNGEPTYFAADIGYVTEKFSRGFDHLIYIWGADHHGTVARVRNAAEAMGYDREAVQMLLVLLGPLRARRRGGLDEQARRRVHHPRRAARRGRRRRRALVLRVTRRDHRRSTSTSSWPRSSRTRTRSTTSSTPTPGSPRSCARRPRPGSRRRPASTARSAGRPKAALARAIARFPEVVEDAVAAEETQGITAYATELATTFHAFYRDARVVDADEPERSAARLALAARDPGHAGERARPAGDLRARVDVTGDRPRGGLAGQAQDAGDLLEASRRRSPTTTQRRRAARRRAATWPIAAGLRRARSSAAVSNSAASAPCPRPVSWPAPRRRPGPSMTASRSPPQPAAASSRRPSARRRPRAARSPVWNSPNVSWSGTVQPVPRRVARSAGQVDATAPRRRRTSPGGGSARSTRASGRRARRRRPSRRSPAAPGRS